MKRSAKYIAIVILLAMLSVTALITLSGCGIFFVITESGRYATIDGVHYELYSGSQSATARYFDADKTLAEGELQVCKIPEKIKHRGDEYTVTYISGEYYGDSIIVGDAQIGELIVPKTVNYINLFYYDDLDSLTKITVDEDNSYYHSKDGVLFRSSYYGYDLEYYPLGKQDDTFEFPAQLRYIEHISRFWDNEHLQNFEIEEGSDTYTSIGGALYSLDGEELMLYPLHRTDDTFVAPKSMRRINLNSRFWENKNITKVEVEADSEYLKVEDNVLYSLNGSELLFRPNDGKACFAIPSTVKVVSYNALLGVEYLYVPESVVVFLDTFMYMAYNIANVDHIYFESEILPKYLRDVVFEQDQLRFGVSRESFDALAGLV